VNPSVVFLPLLIVVAAEELAQTAKTHAAYDVFEDIVCRLLLIDVWSPERFIVWFPGSHAGEFRKTDATKYPRIR